MKKTIVLFVAVLAGMMLAACSPAPLKPPVVSMPGQTTPVNSAPQTTGGYAY
jgi:uncharacterized lipoprotein YbaY